MEDNSDVDSDGSDIDIGNFGRTRLFHPPIFSIIRHTRAVHNNNGPLLPLGVEPLYPDQFET
jgi:hypothetical protein